MRVGLHRPRFLNSGSALVVSSRLVVVVMVVEEEGERVAAPFAFFRQLFSRRHHSTFRRWTQEMLLIHIKIEAQ